MSNSSFYVVAVLSQLTLEVELSGICSIGYWVGIQSGSCPTSVGTIYR